jgi:3-oxoacyl-[acyl-carrier protein] reductase
MTKSVLEGRIAVVTGGASGLGRAIAEALASRGTAVYLVSRRADALSEAAEAIRAAGGRAAYGTADLTEPSAPSRVVAGALEAFGKIDILVNDAGVGVAGPLLGNEPAEIARAVDLNLRAPILLTRAALPELLKSVPSEIVNVASVSGLYPSAESTVYCATKFGFVGFSRALSLELRPAGIRVTTLCPGSVDTPVFEALDPTAPHERRLPASGAARLLIEALEAPPEEIHGEITFTHR